MAAADGRFGQASVAMAEAGHLLYAGFTSWALGDQSSFEGRSVAENLEIITTFWRRIWHRQDVCEELQRVREGRLSCPSGPRLPDLRLTGEELLAAARKKAGGASGACGWSGDEVANWPLVLWQALAGLLRRWNERGSYPEVWQHYRQVTLAKREPKDGKLAVKDTRPISIQSSVCRTIASALANKPAIREWFKRAISASTHGGVHGRGVASAIFDLADSFDQPHAVLLSLDLRKGYDFADPEIIIGHMKHRGLPLQWCRYFEHMWCNQSRWIVWDRHVSPEPEKVARSTPQGDPFAVIGFCLLLAEASHDFNLHHHGDAAQALFVDDRSLVVNHPSQLRPVYDHWTEWSNRLGFQENLDKLAIVCASPGDEAEVLQQGFSADNVHKETCVLGVDFIQRGHHEEGDAARTRRLTALKMLKRLQTAPLGARIREVLVSTRILPKACWGYGFTASRNPESLGPRSSLRSELTALAHVTCGNSSAGQLRALRCTVYNIVLVVLQMAFAIGADLGGLLQEVDGGSL